MTTARLHAPAVGEKVNLIIRHYGEKEGLYNLYDDDGVSFDYDKGAYSWRRIRFKRNALGKLEGDISTASKNKPNTVGTVAFELMGQ